MANIFRSKEIYKKTVDQENNDNLYKIRGLYVVGDYSPATYNNPLTCIVDIRPNKARVVDFTRVTRDLQTDHALNIVNFDMDVDIPTLVRFSRKTEELQTEHALNIVNFDMDPDIPDILKYTKVSMETGTDHVLNIVHFDMDPCGPPVLVKFLTKYSRDNIQPCLRLTALRTTHATCVDTT